MHVITRGLVCSYADISEAYQVFYNEFLNLKKLADDTYCKTDAGNVHVHESRIRAGRQF
jgi:hypothetical protein